MTKKAGSGSISQSHGSADPDPDPDPPQNVMDPQHWMLVQFVSSNELTLHLKMLIFSSSGISEN